MREIKRILILEALFLCFLLVSTAGIVSAAYEDEDQRIITPPGHVAIGDDYVFQDENCLLLLARDINPDSSFYQEYCMFLFFINPEKYEENDPLLSTTASEVEKQVRENQFSLYSWNLERTIENGARQAVNRGSSWLPVSFYR